MTRISRYQEYPELRQVLAPQFRNLPAESIEALLETYNLSAEDMEGFFDTLKDIGKAVVNVAPSVLPVAGTVLGTAFGGPAGAALGGTLGKLAGGAISQATGQNSPPTPPAASGLGRHIPQAPPGSSPAAGQLVQTMFRPETLQSLMSMLLGQLGSSNVNVGGRSVPVGGFTNLMATLANQAQAEYIQANPRFGEAQPEYMRDYAGEAISDPALAENRARVLLEMLQETVVESRISRRSVRPVSYGVLSPIEEEAYYAELTATEAYNEIDD